MISFLYSDLVAILYSILELVVTPDILNECRSGKDIVKLNLDKDLLHKKMNFLNRLFYKSLTQRFE